MKMRFRIDMRAFLVAVSDGLLLFELNGKYRHAYMRDGRHGIHRLLASEERREIGRAFDAARRRGLIAESRIRQRLVLTLTERGRETLDRKVLRSAGRRTDGKRVCIMYDIPERFRSSRDRLRTLLKRAGVKRHQRSIWITDRDVADILESWVRRNRLEKWVDIVAV